ILGNPPWRFSIQANPFAADFLVFKLMIPPLPSGSNWAVGLVIYSTSATSLAAIWVSIVAGSRNDGFPLISTIIPVLPRILIFPLASTAAEGKFLTISNAVPPIAFLYWLAW